MTKRISKSSAKALQNALDDYNNATSKSLEKALAEAYKIASAVANIETPPGSAPIVLTTAAVAAVAKSRLE